MEVTKGRFLFQFPTSRLVLDSGCAMIGGYITDALKILRRPTSDKDESRILLKQQLMDLVQLKQSASNREATEQILEELVVLNRDDPRAFEAKLSGNWRLLWSSQTADTNPWQTPASVLGGDCYQVVVEEDAVAGPRVENVVVWPALGNLTLRGGAKLKRDNATDCIIEINSFTLELAGFKLPLLQLTDTAPIAVRDVNKLKSGSQLVTISSSDKAERVLNRREGRLKLLYVDRDGLRVSQGDNGLLYVHQRMGDSD